jgi:hypothetical protein
MVKLRNNRRILWEKEADMNRPFPIMVTISILTIALTGCKSVSPVPACFHGAKIHADHLELTGYGYMSNDAGGDGTVLESVNIGFQLSNGFRKRPFFLPYDVEFAPRLIGQLTFPSHGRSTQHIAAFLGEEIQLSIIKDILAVAPAAGGFHLSDEFLHMQVDPIIIHATAPIGTMLEINSSFRYTLMTCEPEADSSGAASYIGITLGLGAGANVDVVAIRPELAYLHNLNGDNHLLTIGIGASLFSETSKEKKQRERGRL